MKEMKQIVNLARILGKILLDSFDSEDNRVADKNGAYKIDYELERIIEVFVAEKIPEYALLSEDSALKTFVKEPKKLLIVDPLDGSSNFVRHFPVFNVSIAICDVSIIDSGVFDFSRVQSACVFSPVLDRLYLAQRDHGSSLNGKELRVVENPNAGQNYIGGIWKYDVGRDLGFLGSFKGVRSFGCATEHICSLARSDSQGYIALDNKLRVCDIAAAGLVPSLPTSLRHRPPLELL